MMQNRNLIALCGAWYAEDIAQNQSGRLSPLSVHDHVINFKVDSWPHLLMTAAPKLDQGPAAIGLRAKDFTVLQEAVNGMNSGFFKPPLLSIITAGTELEINWRQGKKASFEPFLFKNLDPGVFKKSADTCRKVLQEVDASSPAAVLLGQPGGENFFREKISSAFPALVDALLAKDAPAFIECGKKLAGMGRGFSPTGDDLIHGALVAFHYLSFDRGFTAKIAEPLTETARQTNPMGRHMLETGRRGLSPGLIRDYIVMLVEGRFDHPLIRNVLRLGSGTGYEIAVAILYYLDCFSDRIRF